MPEIDGRVLSFIASWPKRLPSSEAKIGKQTYIRITTPQIARALRCSARTVFRALRRLDTAGLITRHIHRGGIGGPTVQAVTLLRLTRTGRKFTTPGKPKKDDK